MSPPSPEKPRSFWAQLEGRPGAALLLAILCGLGAWLLQSGLVGESKVRSPEVLRIRSVVGALLFLSLSAAFARSAWRGWQNRRRG